jgi:GLPGLI family protein
MKKLLFVLTAVMVVGSASAQKKAKGSKEFEGKVVYDLSFPGLEIDATQAAMLPKESVVYIKQGRSRTEMSMGMGMSTTVLSDPKTKTATLLYDMMGTKMAMKTTEEDRKKEQQQPEPTVTVTNETKDIAGYKCKKAEVKLNDAENTSMIVYYSPDLATKDINWYQGPMKVVDGFPMEYEMKQQGLTMRFSAKTVSKENVDEAKFTVPADYKQTTKEEMQQMFGGGQ